MTYIYSIIYSNNVYFNEFKGNLLKFINMYVMNYKGEIVYFDMSKFSNDEEMYINLWKLLYNINIPKNDKNFAEDILDYVNGEKLLV